MFNLLRFIPFIVLVITGCSQKAIYQFTEPVGSFEPVAKAKLSAIATHQPVIISQAAEENIAFSAALPTSLKTTRQPVAFYSRVTSKTEAQPVDIQSYPHKQKFVAAKPLIKIKNKPADEPTVVKPVHKLAKIGFALSFAAVLLHVVGLTLTGIGGGFLVLAFFSAIAGLVLSKIGLKRIKANPELYAGRGYAWAGFLLGSLQLLFYLIIIAGFMAWAGTFS